MQAINRGNRVWVIRGNDVERGTVTSSHGDSTGITYRVRWGEGSWSGIASFSHRDVFRDESVACSVLADRLTRLVGDLLARAGQQPIDCEMVTTCRHGIDN